MPERRGSTPTFILERFKRPLGAPRVAGSYDSEGCLRAVWNDETQSFEIVLEFWSDRSAYLDNLRDIFFDGIPSQPIMQRPVQEALRPGLWILNHSQLDSSPYYCLQFKEKSVRDACALFKPFMQIGYAWLCTSSNYVACLNLQYSCTVHGAGLQKRMLRWPTSMPKMPRTLVLQSVRCLSS